MTKKVTIIGGGPAGLMAAEKLSARGIAVSVYDRKPSVGRKFLMAGRGGLNITHSEPLDSFIEKYGAREDVIAPLIRAFTPQDLRDWCEGLGQKTFVGSSGRVFPESFKASPLMRAWITRLESQNVQFFLNHDWQGWHDGALVFHHNGQTHHVTSDAILLALGGASWPRLGSDGSWVDILKNEGVDVAPLCPSNCGFVTGWSNIFKTKCAGQPLKPVALSFGDKHIRGEIMITQNGIEGGAVYAMSSVLRDAITEHGHAVLCIDLKPDLTRDEVITRLQKPRKGLSLSNFLKKHLSMSDVAFNLLTERNDRTKLGEYAPEKLADIIKQYELVLTAPFDIDRAISSSGGVTFDAIDNGFMLHKKHGVFVAGEMLDWEAPTGGYLLQACMACGVHVAESMTKFLQNSQEKK